MFINSKGNVREYVHKLEKVIIKDDTPAKYDFAYETKSHLRLSNFLKCLLFPSIARDEVVFAMSRVKRVRGKNIKKTTPDGYRSMQIPRYWTRPIAREISTSTALFNNRIGGIVQICAALLFNGPSRMTLFFV